MYQIPHDIDHAIVIGKSPAIYGDRSLRKSANSNDS